jgi:nitrous oxidase accessory protein
LLLGAALIVGSLRQSAAANLPRQQPQVAQRSLQGLIDEATPGDIIQLRAGAWSGPVTIDKPLTLRGHGATLDGHRRGTALRVDAPNVTIERLTIKNSGDNLDGPDACIYLTKRATRARLSGNTLSNCAFGIWVHQTERAVLDGNRIHGSLKGHRSDRGNGIQLFDASRLVVRNNEVSGGRDGIYVSATDDSRIEGNRMRDTRYGIHYMFSYRNVVARNRAHHNLGGIALMQSREITATDNTSTDNEGHGILFRDAQLCTIRHNRVMRNGNGLFFFSSVDNVIEHNVVAHNEVGAKIWAGSNRNQVANNTFVGNRIQIFYVAAEDLVWGDQRSGNFWSDYLGWDQNADGFGDRPYRVDSFTTRLIHRFPAAALLLRSPALELLTHLEQTVPVLRTPTIVDRQPLSRMPE